MRLSRKRKAQISRQLRNAVAKGTVVKPKNCSRCNKPKQSFFLHGHHKDYSKPLEVKWLCHKCHGIERGGVKQDKPERDKNRDRVTYKTVLLPKLKDSPFVNRGLLQQNGFLDEHKYFDPAIDWGPYLKQLTYRQGEIIKLRYGLGDGYIYTLQELAKIFKVTPERVRQVEKKALMQLKTMVA